MTVSNAQALLESPNARPGTGADLLALLDSSPAQNFENPNAGDEDRGEDQAPSAVNASLTEHTQTQTPLRGRSAGQPTKYKPEYCEMVKAHMADNHGLSSFAGTIGVSFKTVYKWAAAIPEFGEAVDIGKGLRIYEIEEILAAPKSGPQIAGAIFLAKNVMPDEYREKVEHSFEGLSDSAVAALTEAIKAGVIDALKQLGAQTVDAMRGTRILDHGAGRQIGPVIEAEFVEVPAPDTPNAVPALS